LKEFDAEVLEVKKIDDKYGLILDRTAFYPGGGGQPADKGVIKGKSGEIKILQAQTLNGTVVHIGDKIEGELRTGEKVKGVVDWGRRYSLMKNHTTAHLMAEALRRATGTPLKIVGSAIDVDKARLDLAYEKSLGPLLPEIEKAANSIVKEKLPVEVKMMKREEAEEYVKRFHESLETLPPQVKNVRIVEIKGLHACACGGTHVKNTSEIESVKALKRRSKGRDVERIEFVAKSLTREY
jgi:misacylated tRNA(Ala) deacylase